MKKISIFLIAVMLAQSAFGEWNAIDMSNSIMGGIMKAGKSSGLKTQIADGGLISIPLFGLLFAGGTAAAGVGIDKMIKAEKEMTPRMRAQSRKHHRPKWMPWGSTAKHIKKIRHPNYDPYDEMALSPIQSVVFKKLDAKKLKQIYGVVRIRPEAGKIAYMKSNFGKITGKIGTTGLAFSKMNVQGIMKNVKVGGYGR